MFFAYIWVALAGMVAGRFVMPMIVTPWRTTSLPGSVPSTLPPISAAMSMITLPGFMLATIVVGDEARGGPPGDERGRDDEVGLLDPLGDELGLAALVVVAHLGRVAAGRLGGRLLLRGHLDLDEGPAEALDLLLDHRPHVGRLDHRAQSARRADRHQAGDTGAHDDSARRPDRPRGGGQQREELRQLRRGDEDRLVAADGRLAS